ncbi:pyridoxamine 5'-phosphate oxidase [Herbaspirillum sp. RTI4]|uniref:pyridoxamine 5'-phosphate oxidase n=1 Tax=Herbaspirillum sp. RTI4 TaxID=3048640 RepID=UPI002AB40E54|nr:pyridoxamine 5'-phosphate oxidase [Herbaspirillum sp. RTI4]MDY7576787.1 pyridoxamine 5'-phosphate oxidase [Herbaspirillum sp. RTI4]MEA9981383.1 pyridoxamine 5'-phosphate oxidase [Herbaspirillum sp. RTI4]
MTISHLRKEYKLATLAEQDVTADPFSQFSIWFDEALKAELPEPNTMTLSTVSAEGRPSSRIVLIKNADEKGFSWFTNYNSRKGLDLAAQPYASLLFYWIELERQVRIEGRVEKVSAEESDAYFAVRPLGSRLGAIASQQSQPIADRAALEQQYARVEQSEGEHPVRPAHWGGYRLIPDEVEFWQGRPSRLHDRLLYSKTEKGEWHIKRLQP